MIREAIEHHTARVVAVSRLAVAIVFFVAVWVDPTLPARYNDIGYELLAGYIVFSVAMLPIAWNDWWLDHRLRIPVFLIDSSIFVVSVYLTETNNADFVSPFLGFFAFLIFSAQLRGGWRATAVTAMALTLACLLVAVLLGLVDADINVLRTGRRLAYMAILSLLVIWFGLQQRGLTAPRLDSLPDGTTDRMLDSILIYAMASARADAAVIAWTPDEEPRTMVRTMGGLGVRNELLGPDELPESAADSDAVLLFDRRRAVSLALPGREEPIVARHGPVDCPLAERFGINAGVTFALGTASGTGLLVLTNQHALCVDHLDRARGVAHEIEAALDRHGVAEMARDATVTRMRDSIARDLHDSIAQSLAGACLRLEAMRARTRKGENLDDDIATMIDALRGEQRHVRSIIERLKLTAVSGSEHDLAVELCETLSGSERQWQVETAFDAPPEPVRVPHWLSHELQQLIREAVANAVRHGDAHRIAVRLAHDGGLLRLSVQDDGKGFPSPDAPVEPQSIGSRVRTLGGVLVVESRPGATRLDIVLPVG